MKRNKILKCLILTCFLLQFQFIHAKEPGRNVGRPRDASVIPSGLNCEYRTNTLGIDESTPLLGWKILSDDRAQKQTGYHVLISSSIDKLNKGIGDMWDTGMIKSDQSVNVVYKGKPLKSLMRYFWKVRVWDKDNRLSAWSKPTMWSMGLLKPEDWTAKWIECPNEDPKISHWLRKSFDLSHIPDYGQVFLNISGYAELYINNQKVGGDVLTPATSDLKKLNFYVTYDVTKYLTKGRNVIGIWLGRGWAASLPSVRLQLNIGPKEKFVLNTDKTWRYKPSNYRWIGKRKWNNFGGEQVDAREANPKWCRPSFDDSQWDYVKVIPGPRGRTIAQKAPLNRIGKEIPAVVVKEFDGSKYLIDFGVNLTGWIRLKMPQLETGRVVTMTFADVMNHEKHKRPQHFNQISKFISAGKSGEVFEHKFNYAGFRYVIVSGLPSAPLKEDAVAMLIESDLKVTGSFKCSSKLFNDIHHLVQWTQRCLNLGGYYVDCPHRERKGYGDGQVAVEGFMTRFQSHGYYRKWLHDWRLQQRSNGYIPNL